MKYYRRNVLLLFIVLASTVACKKKDDLNTNVKSVKNLIETKKVRFIGQWLNEGKRAKLVKDFCREYEFKNQHIQIDLKFPEQLFEDHADRTSNVRFVGEIIKKQTTEWDIIRLNNQYSAISEYTNDPLWAKNNLVDFSQIPEFINNTSPELLTSQAKEAWGGIIPGPFLEGSYWALWSNRNVAAKLGITIKSKGMTFEDLLSYVKTVDQHNKNNPNDYIVPFHEASDWRTIFALVYQLYTSELSSTEELYNGQVTENKLLAWHKTLMALEELSHFNPFDPNWQNVNWAESNNDLLDEKCLFYTNGSWMYNIWESTNATNLMNAQPNELPVFNRTITYPSAYFITWGVLKNSPNKDEAVKLLLAMNKPDIAEMWVQYTKCPTGVRGRLTDLSFGTDQFEDFSNYIQNQYSNNIYNYSEEVSANINGNANADLSYYREVLTKEMTADEAMELIRNNLGKI